MTRRLISTGSPFERQAGYSRAVVDGDWCFVAGTTGYDYSTMTMPADVATQATNAMATIDRTLIEAGFTRADIVRVSYIITDASFADAVFGVVGPFFADIRPAATMIVAGLIRPEMKVEIEVTAKRSA
jgi:enamine deaminase RidA (YjgF/YER057c/UK114 family)